LGTSTDAHCFACGYDTFLMLGGSMANHATYAAWPVSCTVCSAITTANFKQSPLVCQECKSNNVIPVIDPHVWKGDGGIIERWGDLTLTDEHYRCPKCSELELRFGTNVGGHGKMMWD
jgi:DNA-directed RNA polymerase subunit RPC12/RpoP